MRPGEWLIQENNVHSTDDSHSNGGHKVHLGFLTVSAQPKEIRNSSHNLRNLKGLHELQKNSLFLFLPEIFPVCLVARAKAIDGHFQLDSPINPFAVAEYTD